MHIWFYDTLIGRIGIAERDGSITNLYFETDRLPQNSIEAETPILIKAAQQLTHYFAGEFIEFTLPLAPQGTPFMTKVWEELCHIPYGQTVTYKEIAIRIGNERASRAVGLANNRNPIPIFIPCHRVIGSNRTLTGYRGGLETKKKLLDIEGK